MRNFTLLFFSFWIVTLFLPWWTLLIPAVLLGATLFESSAIAFFTGFISLSAAWAVQALYIDIANESILSGRMAEMLGVGQSWLVILITALIGGLIGGMGTLLGAQIRLLLQPGDARSSRAA
ncbi:hypothetical protein [Rhodohalobacter sp. 8-1]|uniref:hypothetical protein n=1 Tax=Rhodohalobacter sp. 8-1 TaxID=3131972 RepID=UPI0030ED7D44